jgi:hypothetical protein
MIFFKNNNVDGYERDVGGNGGNNVIGPVMCERARGRHHQLQQQQHPPVSRNVSTTVISSYYYYNNNSRISCH